MEQPEPDLRSPPSRSVSRRWLATVCLLALIPPAVLAGWLVYRDSSAPLSEEESARQADEEALRSDRTARPAFDFGPLRPMPHDDTELLPGVKPGHWVAVSQTCQANLVDFRGELALTPLDRQSAPLPVPNTPFTMQWTRPVDLPKEQPKRIESVLHASTETGNLRLRSGLLSPTGREARGALEEFRPMPAYQYSLVVLAEEPARYGYLRFLDSIRAPSGGIPAETVYYQVYRPDLRQGVPLPSGGLTWTGIAYAVWDRADPSLLDIEQRQAMLDWLHWGGQLIVSGPDTLDRLRGSFLERYLPASAGAAWEIDTERLALLSERYQAGSLPSDRQPLAPARPWSGVRLEPPLDPAANLVPLAETSDGDPLVVERLIGRGRIVVTAFDLRQAELINWAGFDNFFNACLLRREPRVYTLGDEEFSTPELDWQSQPGRRLDPRLVTRLRYFSRDSGFRYTPARRDADPYGTPSPESVPASLGAWNPESAIARAARETLTEAAGIEIPEAGFVLRVLATYLVVIVPLNWLLFRLIGRVEWAWIAAPLIAIVAAGLVIRLAQLDIGFARSKTELAVLEMQPGYERAHLTRYVALYSSLTSRYQLRFDDRHALVQPFPADPDYSPALGERSREVRFRRDRLAELTGFPVLSNRTGLLHSEEMFEMEGGLDYLPGATASIPHSVTNRTRHDLEQAVLLVGLEGRRYRVGWIGDLPSGERGGTVMREIADSQLSAWYLERRQQESAEADTSSPLDPTRLVRVGLREGELNPGDVRLVALLSGDHGTGPELPGVSVSPAGRQSRQAAMLVAHLEYGPLPAPRSDANARPEVPQPPQDLP